MEIYKIKKSQLNRQDLYLSKQFKYYSDFPNFLFLNIIITFLNLQSKVTLLLK